MPWETKTVMEEREAFVLAVELGEKSIATLCREFGISRKTGYKWLNRAKEGQPLCDQSRCPHRQPSKTARDTEELILEMRTAHPVWGGKKIKAALESAGYEGIPSAKTCGNILRRYGMIDPAESQKHTAFQRFQRESCNELWQMDFKGDFLLGDGNRCYPLDILDDHSRYCIQITPKSSASGAIESVTLAFREFGLPDSILSDNGSQFSGFRGGYTQFERWLMDLDILPIHGRIMHPQTQGKVERFHRTMKAEALRTTPANLEHAKQLLSDWRWRYNELRPHEALGMKPPAAVYRESKRQFSEPKPFLYNEGARLVKVNNWGYLRFGPIQVYLSETMKDTYLEIRPADLDTFRIIYRNYQIAVVDAVDHVLLNKHIRKL